MSHSISNLIYFSFWSTKQQCLQSSNNSQILGYFLETASSIKVELDIDQLCQGIPEEFGTYLKMVRKLEFEEEPEYWKYINLFDELFNKKEFVWDYCYDWIEDGKSKKKEKFKETLMYNNKEIYNKVEELTNIEEKEENDNNDEQKDKTKDKEDEKKQKDNCQIY